MENQTQPVCDCGNQVSWILKCKEVVDQKECSDHYYCSSCKKESIYSDNDIRYGYIFTWENKHYNVPSAHQPSSVGALVGSR